MEEYLVSLWKLRRARKCDYISDDHREQLVELRICPSLCFPTLRFHYSELTRYEDLL